MCSRVCQRLPFASAQPLTCAAGLCGHARLQCSAGGLWPGLHNCCQPQCDCHSAQPHRCHALHCVAGGTGHAVITAAAGHCHSCGLDTATAHPTTAERQHRCWLSGLWAQVSYAWKFLAGHRLHVQFCVACGPGCTLLRQPVILSFLLASTPKSCCQRQSLMQHAGSLIAMPALPKVPTCAFTRRVSAMLVLCFMSRCSHA